MLRMEGFLTTSRVWKTIRKKYINGIIDTSFGLNRKKNEKPPPRCFSSNGNVRANVVFQMSVVFCDFPVLSLFTRESFGKIRSFGDSLTLKKLQPAIF